MNKKIITDKNYASWLKQLKERVRVVQLKAAVKVNTELLTFYWELGADIVERQKETRWGDGFLSQLSKDLMAEFPDMKGFSFSNLKYVRRWYLFYNQHDIFEQQAVDQLDNSKGQQLVAEITQIPWGITLSLYQNSKGSTKPCFMSAKPLKTVGRARCLHTKTKAA